MVLALRHFNVSRLAGAFAVFLFVAATDDCHVLNDSSSDGAVNFLQVQANSSPTGPKRVAVIIRGESFRTQVFSPDVGGSAGQVAPGKRTTCGGDDGGKARQEDCAKGQLKVIKTIEDLGYAVDVKGLTYPCSESKDPAPMLELPSMYEGRMTKADLKLIREEHSTQLSTLISAFQLIEDPSAYDYIVLLRWDVLYGNELCVDQLFDGKPHDYGWIDPRPVSTDYLQSIPGSMVADFMTFLQTKPVGDRSGCCEGKCPVVCNYCIGAFYEYLGLAEGDGVSPVPHRRPTSSSCSVKYEYAGPRTLMELPPFVNDYDEECAKELAEGS